MTDWPTRLKPPSCTCCLSRCLPTLFRLVALMWAFLPVLLFTLCSAARDGSARASAQPELQDMADVSAHVESSARSKLAKPAGTPEKVMSHGFRDEDTHWMASVISDCYDEHSEEDLDGWALCISMLCKRKFGGFHHQVILGTSGMLGSATFAENEATFTWGDFFLSIFKAKV